MTKLSAMKNTKIAQVLCRLMAEKKLRVAELARRVNLPQPTVHRIATGLCEHPHHSSLEPIAEYFSISVEQLKGHEPIQTIDKYTKVALIDWEDLLQWPKVKTGKDHEQMVTDAVVSSLAYAIKLKDASMDPVFPINTVLIADPKKTARDRSYVIAKLNTHAEPVFRQLLQDASDQYLKPLSPDLSQFKMLRLSKQDKIISTVVQAKRDYD